MQGLRDLRVVDLSRDIAGAYCTRLLADAGADVILVEPASGHPLRRFSAGGAQLGEEDGALFRFLHHGKRSVVGEPGEPALEALRDSADLLVDGFVDAEPGARGPAAGQVRLSITPYGRRGPYAGRPATEFTIQADCGSIATRGLPGREPFQCGGRTPEWVAGTYAAVAALAALRRARASGQTGDVDFSLFELMSVAGTNYMELIHRLLEAPEPAALPQSIETPSIEPTADGYVGFCTNSRQQLSDFLLLIERPDLRDDASLITVAGRMARLQEWSRIVHAFTRRHSTAEIVERAAALRIPVAPVNDAPAVFAHEQLVARGVFRRAPGGRFRYPRPPYQIDGQEPPARGPAPRQGEHTGRIEERQRVAAGPGEGAPGLPLEGLRILDLTAWWAGPAATHMLASLGAEVVHVESPKRPDGMRMVGGMLAGRRDEWWECSHFFLAANANKRGLALDLQDPRGLELMRRLVRQVDAVVDNFSPRVLEHFGLDGESFRRLNPSAILLRMPAFGLSGPWRDHVGFAQTMEQVTGLAWLTGHPDDQPRIQRGPCDPLAGMHAAFAFLLALGEREAKGEGVHVECTMVEGALNAAAELLVEWSAYGHRLERQGNRAPWAAPQGLYRCRGHGHATPRWLALSVASDAQWQALVRLLGEPGWAREPSLASLAGRRAAHDAIDRELCAWAEAGDRDARVEALVAAGVPAAPLRDPRLLSSHPQMVARGFHETLRHPVAGALPTPGLPFRYAGVERWLRSPAPTLGQHGREILGEWLGLGSEEIDRLESEGVIGTRPSL